jgi:carbamoyl-phosphate synthase small subunit
MNFEIKRKAVVLLQDGTIFYGRAAGATGTATGEICFNTAMTGYQETFTDPSYKGQILVTTNAHIGNYGVTSTDTESASIQISALICKNFSLRYSRNTAESSVDTYFRDHNVVVVSDVDTRALVRHIRSMGAMNAIISTETDNIDELKAQLNSVPSMEGLELSSSVSVSEPYLSGNPDAKYRVALLDLGVKENIIRCLNDRNCLVRVFPMNTTPEHMQEWNPHGYMISNGPGDPETLTGVINTVKFLIHNNKKVFGICLGHQVLALAMGIPTYKMYNGHRGINHPILNIVSGKGEITSQNHGFVVDEKAILENPEVEVTHRHLNDNTIAGIRVKNKQVFSVQYHPEASAGPHDSRYLFDQFVESFES